MPNYTKVTNDEQTNRIEIFNNFTANRTILLPSIGLCLIFMSLVILIWLASRLKHERPATTLYSAANGCSMLNGDSSQSIDIESQNRYVKLQTTTSL